MNKLPKRAGIYLAGIGLTTWLAACSATPEAPSAVATPSATTATSVRVPSSGVVAGFDYANEARHFIEFCVELNSQDDRLKGLDRKIYGPQLQGSGWEIMSTSSGQVMDSRRLLAGANDGVFNDPSQNGFGPYKNAWLIYRHQDGKRFALAIRGTVVSSSPTVLEDALLNTLKAKPGIAVDSTSKLRFADFDAAAVHSGFAYGTLSLLFDEKYGVAKFLRDSKLIPSGSTLYIVGHSQGAAMAALLHSALHYAMLDGKFGFGSGGQMLGLKSYGFAQPKPGNLEYAEDFSNLSFADNSGVVVNNISDVVPRVPLTINLPHDALKNLSSMRNLSGQAKYQIEQLQQSDIGMDIVALKDKLGGKLAGLRNRLHRDEPASGSGLAAGLGAIHAYQKQHPANDSTNYNYATAGFLVPLLGKGHYTGQINDPAHPDEFIEHHAATYRQLLAERFAVGH